MSSSVLHKAVLDDDPLVIDNTFFLPVEPEEERGLAEDLAETLQQEHPDTEPEVIEDAIQDAIEQLMEAPEDEPPATVEDPDNELLGFGFEDGAEPPIPLADATLDAEVEPELDLLLPDPETVLAELAPEKPSEDPQRAADELLDKARREAAQVLSEADTRAAEIERAAYDKGYQEGLGAGTSAGEVQAAEMMKQVTAIVDQATELHDTMLHEAEGEMVALCLEIARKIIQAELRTNPDVVKSVLAAAVQKINGSPRVTIKVNPSQLQSVRDHWAHAFGPDYREKEWIIEADPDVVSGGCVLETKYGSIDAQIGAQFAEIQKTFALLLGTQS